MLLAFIIGGIIGAVLMAAFVYIGGRLIGNFFTFFWYGTCSPDKPSSKGKLS